MKCIYNYIVWLGIVLASPVFSQEGPCGDTSLFPITLEGQTYISCVDFGETAWCRLDSNEFKQCPENLFSGAATDAVIVVDEPAENVAVPETFFSAPQNGDGPKLLDVLTDAPQEYNVPEPTAVPEPEPKPTVPSVPDPEIEFSTLISAPASNDLLFEVFDDCVSDKFACVVINEFMASNENVLFDLEGDSSDWIEFENRDSQDVSMQGWFVSDNLGRPTKWMFPDVNIPANGKIVIFASGKNKRTPGLELHTNFRLSDKGEFLGLFRPDGSIASTVRPKYPPQLEDISFGRPDFTEVAPEVQALVNTDNTMAYLLQPTPGLKNSGPNLNGPFILSVTDKIQPQPLENQDIEIIATLSPNFYQITSASLFVVLNFDFTNKVEIEMTQGEDGKFFATIPGTNLVSGAMVRWYVQAYDEGGAVSRYPPFTTADHPEYYGTVVYTSEVRSVLPVLQWFVEDTADAISQKGSRSAVFYNGYLYDNVFTRRRGITALGWPKPKLKFDFKGSIFEYDPKKKAVEEFNLQSFWVEPGEDSYMREVVAFKVLQEAEVPASDAFHLNLFMNNEFFGLFGFIQQVDDTFLEEWGFNTAGYLYKSTNGEFTNLRWDQKVEDYVFNWKASNHQQQQNWQLLYDFTQGLAGAGPGSRSEYVMDHVNLPQIVNEMAVQTMFLNQDRCTKNFYVYYDVDTEEWFRFPWDMEGAFGISNGYQGIPAPDYCILIGEQWNSPLYCNNEHPQDLVCFDAFSGTVIDPDPFKGCDNKQCGEDLIPQMLNGQLPPGFNIPDNYDDDLTKLPSLVGSRSTYNHLTDAILDIPETREMYLRRLRSIMDQFMQSGRMVEIIDQTYKQIQAIAELDDQYWRVMGKKLNKDLEVPFTGDFTHNVTAGYKQLVEEQIPRRSKQLYETYGPDGRLALVPEAQPSDAKLEIISVNSQDVDPNQHYIEIYNPNDFAVDISNWLLTGSVQFTFAPGTVIPHDYSVYVTPSVKGFRGRENSPKGGQRNFVVGPWKSRLPQVGYVLTLENSVGFRVDQKLE